MVTSLPSLNVTSIPSPSSPVPSLRRPHIVSRQNTPPAFSFKADSQRLSSSPSLHSSLFSPFRYRSERFLRQDSIRSVTVRSQLSTPLISPIDEWGMWTALFATGAFGICLFVGFEFDRSEKTKIGSAMSGALVSTLIGLAARNLGIISSEAPAFSVMMNFLLPLAVPLLLFRADLRRVIQSTGKLLFAFLIGSFATTVGTVLAYLIVPMKSLGSDSWKIAAALMGRHIGGAGNYIAIAKALDVSPSVIAAGLAADSVICALYFMSFFALASKIPAEFAPPESTSDDGVIVNKNRDKITVIQMATGIVVSLAICKVATVFTTWFGISGGSLPAITAIVVVLATIFPSQFDHLAPSGEAMALVLMQVFFAVLGASGNIRSVLSTAPSIFMFALLQIVIHLGVLLGIGKVMKIELRLLLLASNANIGGPTTAAGMATEKGWSSLIVPGILVGIFGIAIATFLGIVFGVKVLKLM
ncbi:PREDICTED: uncharacterized protein LOC104728829 [Camelina sativa]|uniref:Uncharacterized protein LOC104728829 n=1 Tax=Camelina sativa TaxID=90675 RepID=A0ABM0UTF2_CAMSA|nr:PREDICTED: uncharacterized protein LOC104728829 [Camelina sativa]